MSRLQGAAARGAAGGGAGQVAAVQLAARGGVGPGRIFSNSIKLMLERQKFTLYQQDMLLGRQKSTLYQHAAREAKTHILPAGYAGTEGKNYTLLAPCC